MVAAAFLYIAPSQAKLNASYGLVAATFVSGFYLVVSQSVHILHTCVAGLVYLAITAAAIAVGRQKLVLEQQKNGK